MKIADLLPLKRDSLTIVAPGAELRLAIGLLETASAGALLVAAPGGPIEGVLTERCVTTALRRFGDFALHHAVAETMRPRPPACDVRDSVGAVVARMLAENAALTLAYENGRPTALLSLNCLLRRRLTEVEEESAALRRFIAA